MKRCPQFNRVETDETLKFCRVDGAQVQYTEFPGIGHNAWDPAYARAELFEWLLKQKKR